MSPVSVSIAVKKRIVIREEPNTSAPSPQVVASPLMGGKPKENPANGHLDFGLQTWKLR